jgi:small subunit ribosomal protein S3
VLLSGKKAPTLKSSVRICLSKAGGEVSLNIVEIRKPETDAQFVSEGIAQQLERRVSFRRAMKRAVQSALRLGAKGIRVNVSGRLAWCGYCPYGMVP